MATKTAAALATEDVIVEAPHASAEDPANLAAAAARPVSAEIMDALEAAAEKPVAKAKTTKPAAKVAKPAAKAKAVAKPKTTRQIVPFADVTALLTELGMTKTQLAQATGRSSSLVSEWVGSGRKTGLNVDQWTGVQKAARAFAKKGVK